MHVCVSASMAAVLAAGMAAPNVPVGQSAAPAAGTLLWQIPIAGGQVIAEFRPPAQRWLAGHRGVDLAAGPGTPVTSPAAGTVTFVGDVAGRPVVVIDHGYVRSTLEPVLPGIAPGTAVSTGTAIGLIGSGGHCDSSCLHWGVKRGEDYLDPLALVRPYRPVLKTPLAW